MMKNEYILQKSKENKRTLISGFMSKIDNIYIAFNRSVYLRTTYVIIESNIFFISFTTLYNILKCLILLENGLTTAHGTCINTYTCIVATSE